ncbi:META domain-containing protein [Microbulbifer sp. 2205BS26-8]|uniref:META domain-containing protein n=1 Tax=Microbulbifer sp. 2205BS26-8 TaxID=3064386 RepID=UPI00273F75AD|nr:META domain-containing protein [Microbulbifer sp. 2205BS26-8]MDP5208128.1 META domain-containing protein [Microbulbifer sp. 2205BS26-8]
MPQHSKRLQLILPVALSLLLSGCMTTDNPAQALGQSPWSACDHAWILSNMVDGKYTYHYQLLWRKFWRDRPFFTCDRFGYVRGSGGINPYLGRFSLAGHGELSWPLPPDISRMGKIYPSDALETDYLRALRKTRFLEVMGDQLILRNSDKSTLLEFDRVRDTMR